MQMKVDTKVLTDVLTGERRKLNMSHNNTPAFRLQ